MHLGTRTADTQGCNWGIQIIEGCSIEFQVINYSGNDIEGLAE